MPVESSCGCCSLAVATGDEERSSVEEAALGAANGASFRFFCDEARIERAREAESASLCRRRLNMKAGL